MDLVLFNQLLGPTLPTADIIALGGVFARYEQDFNRFAERHWTTEGSDWASANYYDRAKIFYEQWVSTGNPIWRERADALAIDYRVDYLEANGGTTSAHWNQIGGVALHYALTGDTRDLKAIGDVADNMAAPYYLDNLSNLSGTDGRIQARVLDTFLYAWQVGAPSDGVKSLPGGHDWAKLLESSLDKILASQGADGGYHFTATGNKPFMVGMLNDALIHYYNVFEQDPRILEAVKKSLDYMWEHNWDKNARAFIYDEHDPTPAPDLNNMIVSAFGWVFMMTGDETYRERGDQIFAGGVEQAWLDGSKQFNQAYTTSYQYLAYAYGDDTVPSSSEGSGSRPNPPSDSTNGSPNEPLNALYYLVDADTHVKIIEVKDGDKIDSSLIENRNLTLVVEVNDSSVGSVRMAFDGAATRVEDSKPYALFGDTNGDLHGGLKLDEQNNAEFRFYSADGARGTLLGTESLSFSVDANSDPTEKPSVRYYLVDANTDVKIVEVKDGDQIRSSLIENRNLTLVAETNDSSVQSVRMAFDGAPTRVEDGEPYALFGDTNGDLHGGLKLKEMNNAEFKFYSADGARGTLLGAESLSFSVVPTSDPTEKPLARYYLVDANTDVKIVEVKDGDKINSSLIGNRNLTLVAETNDGSVQSVRMAFDGAPTRVEDVEPYALFGDTNGDLHGGLKLKAQNSAEFKFYSADGAGDLAGK